jgi:BMFP domain-containing protein YqiC
MREKRAMYQQSAPTKPQASRPELRATLAPICYRNLTMLPPKALLDALSTHASRLFNGDSPLPYSEFESQFKILLQSAFSKLDLVSRDEFDSQMVVLARTRARLEALEAKVAEMEARSTSLDTPAASE